MVRIVRFKLLGATLALLVLASCTPRNAEAPGSAFTAWPSDWTTATIFTEAMLSDEQKLWVAGLEPAGGEGEVGLQFTRDFDGDGTTETAVYGSYTKGQQEGNFVLILRNRVESPEVLLLKEVPGPPQFTVFTLKPDGSLWFGGGIDAGEVTMNITWDDGTPVFHQLMPD